MLLCGNAANDSRIEYRLIALLSPRFGLNAIHRDWRILFSRNFPRMGRGTSAALFARSAQRRKAAERSRLGVGFRLIFAERLDA